jgi:hypothetical protein
MEYKQKSHVEGGIKIRLESENDLWDLLLAGPTVYHGKDIYEVSEGTIQILDQKGIPYKRISKTSSVGTI